MIIRNAYYDDNFPSTDRDTMPKEAGHSFSSLVIKRMLRILLENGEMRRSALCGKAGLNYKVCTRYLNFLMKLDWVVVRKDDESGGYISVPSEGIAVLRRLELDENNPLTEVPELQYLSKPRIGEPKRSAEKLREEKPDSKIAPEPSIPNRKKVDGTKKNSPQGKSGSSDRKSIVIIDDDESALVTYKSFLENEECFDIIGFSKSKEALQYLTLHSDSSDLVLLDIRMPGVSGLRIYQAAKALNPNLPIIFLSSIDAAPEVSELFVDVKLGSRIFLRKPVSRSNFIETVRSVLY